MKVRGAPLISFERIVLVCAILFVGSVLSRYDMCFQDAEVLTQHMFDGGQQPRVLSYLGYIATLETRLALWSVLPPHPSFTPLWALTLVVGPILLFKFLEIELRSRPAAMAGVTVYLVSVGYVSGGTMLFHSAKPLTNVAIIATLYLSAKIENAMRTRPGNESGAPTPPYWLWAGLLALLTVAPFADETAAFAYAIPLVWCPRFFWPREWSSRTRPGYVRNWLVYLTPACLAALIMLAILPAVVAATTGRQLDILDYMSTMASEGAQYSKFDVRHIVWQAGNLLIPGLLPWGTANVLTPIADRPTLPIPALIGLALGLLLATALVRGRRIYWSPYRKLGILMATFVVFQSLVVVFHPQELSATGFYYGAIFSVLFAPLVAVVFADIDGRQGHIAVAAARLGLSWVLIISAVNVLAINASWMAHSNAKALDFLPRLPIFEHGADLGPLVAHETRYHHRNSQLREDAVEANYSADVILPGAATPFADAFAIWRNWRRGEADFLAGRPLDIRNLWIAVELDMKTREAPRRWQTVLEKR